MMKLYRVKCVYKGNFHVEDYIVFVVAEDNKIAEEIALLEMRRRKYKYDDFVSGIEFIASEQEYNFPAILIIQKEDE